MAKISTKLLAVVVCSVLAQASVLGQIALDEYALLSIEAAAEDYAIDIEDIANEFVDEFTELSLESNQNQCEPLESERAEYIEVVVDLANEALDDFLAVDENRAIDVLEVMEYVVTETGEDETIVKPEVEGTLRDQTLIYLGSKNALSALLSHLCQNKKKVQAIGPSEIDQFDQVISTLSEAEAIVNGALVHFTDEGVTDIPCPDPSGLSPGGCAGADCPCFGECVDGGYCDDPNCCLSAGAPPDCAVCYDKNTQESINLCGDCFGECLNGSYCDAPDPDCCLEQGNCQCYGPNHHYSIYLCGDCFGQCANGSYCDHANPDCCIEGPTNCQCYDRTDPISITMCGELDDCRPSCVNYDPATQITLVTACDCGSGNSCHATVPEPGAGPPTCVDGCPGLETCTQTETVNANGTIDICCRCDGPIPTVSEWGLVVLTLLLLIGGKTYFARRETATA